MSELGDGVGTQRRVLIAGGSMSPTLEVGDVALVSPARRVRGGEVIAFETRGAPIVHRAVLVVPWPGGALIVHRGDARAAGYGTTRSRAVIGRVVAVERAGDRSPLGRRPPRPLELAGALSKLLRVAAQRGLAARRRS